MELQIFMYGDYSNHAAARTDDTRSFQELLSDLEALVEAGLVTPVADREGELRLAPADDDDDPPI